MGDLNRCVHDRVKNVTSEVNQLSFEVESNCSVYTRARGNTLWNLVRAYNEGQRDEHGALLPSISFSPLPLPLPLPLLNSKCLALISCLLCDRVCKDQFTYVWRGFFVVRFYGWPRRRGGLRSGERFSSDFFPLNCLISDLKCRTRWRI